MDIKKIFSKLFWLIIVVICASVFGSDIFAPKEVVIYENGTSAAATESMISAVSEPELSQLTEVWSKGTFDTVLNSLEYHFAKHGAEVGAEDIADYAQKAADYRTEVIGDISAMSAQELSEKYIVSESAGKIPAHKYKNRSDKRYIIISDEGYYILSFGR